MDGPFAAVELVGVDADPLVGYRLDRLEVLNWGTFDKSVWTFELVRQPQCVISVGVS